MKVYRGPSSKPFYDDSHVYVSKIKPEELEEGIRSNALIRFDVTKDGSERQSVCTARFEEADIIPMISGLLSRLTKQQACLARIKEIMENESTSTDQKISAVRTELSRI